MNFCFLCSYLRLGPRSCKYSLPGCTEAWNLMLNSGLQSKTILYKHSLLHPSLLLTIMPTSHSLIHLWYQLLQLVISLTIAPKCNIYTSYLSGNIYILEYYLYPKSPSGIIYFVWKPMEYIYRTGPGYKVLAVNIN